VHAILDDDMAVLPSCIYLNGKYGIKDVYMSVPAALGRPGVVAVEEIPLDEEELDALQASAATIAEALDSLGLRG
jgi:malate/lactate dehydrogenase